MKDKIKEEARYSSLSLSASVGFSDKSCTFSMAPALTLCGPSFWEAAPALILASTTWATATYQALGVVAILWAIALFPISRFPLINLSLLKKLE